jgi:periplasmic divalent cation tolerance protein
MVYTTFPTIENARSIVKYLLEKKMIVCANLNKHESHYLENGTIEVKMEVGAFLKTVQSKWDSLKELIDEIHPYETPVILKIAVDDSNEEFQTWVRENLLNSK